MFFLTMKNTTHNKPAAICQSHSEVPPYETPEEKAAFITMRKKEVEAYVQDLGLHLRLGTFDDREAILHLRNTHFDTPNSYGTHWFYHLCHYGSCVVLEDERKKLVGYQFEASYLDKEKTSFVAGVAVSKHLKGNSLGEQLVLYSLLLAMEKGAEVNMGIIATDNYPSITTFINHLGATFIDFMPHFPHYGPRLLYKMVLNPATMSRNRLDRQKVLEYIQNHKEGEDFCLVACKDLLGIQALYESTVFRITGLLKAGTAAEHETFIALPKEILGIP